MTIVKENILLWLVCYSLSHIHSPKIGFRPSGHDVAKVAVVFFLCCCWVLFFPSFTTNVLSVQTKQRTRFHTVTV